jgi:ketosteroid isomerase-like protein
VAPTRPGVTGRQALADLYQSYFFFGLASIEIHPEEMYTVGDMICELGSAEAFTASGGVLSNSRYMTLWKKEDGKWRVHRDYLSQ